MNLVLLIQTYFLLLLLSEWITLSRLFHTHTSIVRFSLQVSVWQSYSISVSVNAPSPPPPLAAVYGIWRTLAAPWRPAACRFSPWSWGRSRRPLWSTGRHVQEKRSCWTERTRRERSLQDLLKQADMKTSARNRCRQQMARWPKMARGPKMAPGQCHPVPSILNWKKKKNFQISWWSLN